MKVRLTKKLAERIDGVDLRLCLIESRAGLESADMAEIVAMPIVVGFLLCRKGQRNPEARLLLHKKEISRHHADVVERGGAR